MINELRAELTGLSEKLARRDKLISMLKSLRTEERALFSREAELRAMLNKENADVARLEKTSAASLLYSMLGQKEVKLEKEQQEAYAAKLKYDAMVRQLDDCRSRINALEAEQSTLSGIERRYDEVFRKLQEALKSDPLYAGKVCALERAIGEAQSQLKEIDEAVSAGSACMSQIECIESSLDSAEGWGTWDILGGGLISDIAKHSHLDEAQAQAEYLQTLLSRFRTELADVRVSAQMGQVNVDGFLRFADYFFDGLIADWSVLSHIHDSQHSVAEVEGQVASALSRLKAIRAEQETKLSGLKRELSSLVRNAG